MRYWFNNSVLTQFVGRILPFDQEAAIFAASLNVPDKSPLADSFIAGIALSNRMTVVTRNETDFQFPGLAVVNPFS